MAAAQMDELQRAGLLELASDVGYMDVLATAQAGAPGTSGPGTARPQDPPAATGPGPSAAAAPQAPAIGDNEEEVTYRVIAEAGACTSRALQQLEASSAQLQSMQDNKRTSQSQGRRQTVRRHTPSAAEMTGRGGSTGLRHFAMKVCHKIEAKKLTSYNEVADELVNELKDDPAGADDKNIRRRVYDAFNVLLAVGIIEKKGKKDIVWVGLPMHKSTEIETLQAEQAAVVKSIEAKQTQLKELVKQHNMVKELLRHNAPRTGSEPDMALQIPFVLVAAKPEATVEVSVSQSMREVDFSFNAPFSLHDDSHVLKELIQHHGSVAEAAKHATESAAAMASAMANAAGEAHHASGSGGGGSSMAAGAARTSAGSDGGPDGAAAMGGRRASS